MASNLNTTAPAETVSKAKFEGRAFCVFARQFATLIRAGIPVPDALESLSSQYETTKLGPVLEDILMKICSGHKLSSAMGGYPRIFNQVFRAMVRIGEESGNLDVTFERLADWKERDYDLMRRMKGALVYPSFVFATTVFLTFFMFYYVFPKFMGVVQGMEAELPAITQLAVDISTTLRSPAFWLVFTITTVCLYKLTERQWQTELGRVRIFTFLHRLPVVGYLIRTTGVSRFAGAMDTLLEAGVDLRKTIDLGAQSSGNPVIVRAADAISQRVAEGDLVSEYVAERPDIFPESFAHYIATGEESSRLSDMMRAANRLYEEDLNYRLEAAVALLEPILMATVAAIVGFVVIALASCTFVLFQNV